MVSKTIKKTNAGDAERKVLYPELEALVCAGDQAITCDMAMEMLGWGIVEDEAKDDRASFIVPELQQLYGHKVVMMNNNRNRYVTKSWLQTLKQEHLNKRWRLNGESIVIGKTGVVLSGQHRLISAILAHQEWETGDNKDHWKEIWPGDVGPVFETIVVRGIAEDDAMFQTLNSGKIACSRIGRKLEVYFRKDDTSKFGFNDLTVKTLL